MRSGPALVDYLLSVPESTCIDPLFDGPVALRRRAFRADHVIHVAQSAARLSITYDGTNSSRIETLFYFLQAAYYNEWYVDEIAFTAGVDEATMSALDQFLANPHYADITDEHGFVLSTVFVVLDSFAGSGSPRSGSLSYRTRYLPVVRDWLAGFDRRHLQHWHLVAATVNLFHWVFRGHWDDRYTDHVLADPKRLLDVLRGLALRASLLRVEKPYDYDILLVVRNAAGEFARYVEYDAAPVYPMVRRGIRRILAKYDSRKNDKHLFIWMAVVPHVLHHEDCSDYDLCGADKELEDSLLARRRKCSDTVRLRTQDMTRRQMLEACDELPAVETLFHRQLGTGHRPLPGDVNARLEIIVFADWDQYDLYSEFFFGNDTDNGGIYLEGDPADPSNLARFIAYRADWRDGGPVWNLGHEYVHYLDGRFNMAGGFDDYQVTTHKTLWWLEGLAEWVSRGGRGRPVAERVEDVEGTVPALSRLMAINDYWDEGLYPKSHLAMGFFFERHRGDVESFLDFFRAGDYGGYRDYVNQYIGTNYDEAWRKWLEKLP